MPTYDGVDLNNIIQDSNTNELWSANTRAYDLFGTFLYDNCVEVPVEGLPWLSLVYNPTNPSEVFIKVTVDWSKTDWLKAKTIKSKMVVVQGNESKVTTLQTVDTDTERKIEQGKFLTSLSKNDGMLSKASRMSGVPLSKYRTWMQQDLSFQELVKEVAEEVKDDIESSLITTAKEGDVTAQRYFLDHRASDRGYGTKESLVEEVKQELDLTLLSIDEQHTLVKLLEKSQHRMIE